MYSKIMLFHNRKDAGRRLAILLEKYKNREDAIVLGLPRGGVVVAAEVAHALELPLDIVVPRKIGAPSNSEFAIGAITLDGEPVFDDEIIELYDISQEYLDAAVEKEKEEAKRRLKAYRVDRPPLKLQNKTVILVDDGVATGATMRAAINSVKALGAREIVAAVPVGSAQTLELIRREVDKVVFLNDNLYFGAVGASYDEFEQTSDEEVNRLLQNIS